ncbi:hypothetical protein JCM14076_27100 [Methylosoma difficile]
MNTDDFYLIKCHDSDESADNYSVPCFGLQDLETEFLWSSKMLERSDYLEKLVLRLARKPNRLVLHVQRILYCYHSDLNEQLFAALIDFLVILNRRGKAISYRMVFGSRTRLKSVQLKVFKNYLSDQNYDPSLLPGNSYTIFTRGMIGTSNLIMMSKPQRVSNYDPLDLAHDHIEYSQLDDAKRVLEQGILNDPDRLVLHQELLYLYQLTNDAAGFKRMYKHLTQQGLATPDKWSSLENHFEKAQANG